MPVADQDRFQSHNGSIVTNLLFSDEGSNLLFQSHNGSIVTERFLLGPGSPTIFQSHNGSIVTEFPFLQGRKPFPVSIPQWFDCD